MNKILQLLWNKYTLIVLLVLSLTFNGIQLNNTIKDRKSHSIEIQLLKDNLDHIIQDKDLYIQRSKNIIDSLALIPKASTDEKEKELVIKYKKIYNISTANDSSTQQSLKSILSEPRKFSQESSN